MDRRKFLTAAGAVATVGFNTIIQQKNKKAFTEISYVSYIIHCMVINGGLR